MVKRNTDYGERYITHYLPTKLAERYLSSCLVAGWCQSNRKYHMKYPQGVPFVLILYTIKGKGNLRCGDTALTLSEGSIVVIPSDTPMAYNTAPDTGMWEFYWLNLSGESVESTVKKLWEDGLACHMCRQRSRYTFLLRSLLDGINEPHRQELWQTNTITALFSLLLEEVLFETDSDTENADSLSDQLIAFLQTHYNRPITLDELSREYFLSVNQLIRVFRNRTGFTPYEYLKRYRLTKASELLAGTAMPVREVAQKVGYCNNAHFTSQFRMLYDMTPTEYRTRFSSGV